MTALDGPVASPGPARTACLPDPPGHEPTVDGLSGTAYSQAVGTGGSPKYDDGRLLVERRDGDAPHHQPRMPTHHHCSHDTHGAANRRPAVREGRTSRTDEEHSEQLPATWDGDDGVGPYHRRRILQASGAAAAAALAGCLGGDDDGGDGDEGDAPDPITVPDGATCDVCGMVIVQHPGPGAEIFYADERPAGHDNPARFDSTWEAFQFDFERSGWSREAFYVTDYSAVDYEIRSDDGQQVISRHAAAADFVDVEDVTFVVDSEVVGTMGRDLIGFSEAADAEAFAAEYGGDLGTVDDVSPELISSLGM